MGETIKIAGADGFEFSAYHEPAFTPHKGGVIVLQEIFGIDRHVRADVERWAKMGYEALAPSLFDRREWAFTADHDTEGLQAGLTHARGTPLEQALGDIGACRDFLNKHGGKVEGLAAASSYYGSMVQANAGLKPLCPVIVHLGRTDPGIPADDVAAALAAANPQVPVYIYEGAGHGFNNESPERYNAEAADLARHRTLELFDKA